MSMDSPSPASVGFADDGNIETFLGPPFSSGSIGPGLRPIASTVENKTARPGRSGDTKLGGLSATVTLTLQSSDRATRATEWRARRDI